MQDAELAYKLEVTFAKQKPAMDGCVHKQQRDLCIAQISSFKSVLRMYAFKHWCERQSIYNICILNDCKLTFEFFKNYIFEKRRQFLNQLSVSSVHVTEVQKLAQDASQFKISVF